MDKQQKDNPIGVQEQCTEGVLTFIGQEDIPNKAGVYKVTHEVTGKFYIGSSINMKKRVKSHIQRFRSRCPVNPYFGQALNKYEVKSFIVSVLELVEDINQIAERE